MNRLALLATLFAASLVVALGGAVALAHGQSVAVQPPAARPGEVITVKGEQLGPGKEVEVRLVGAGVDVDLGEVTADAAGAFTAQFRLPATVRPGTYQLRATGAESAAVDLSVVAAPAATEGSTAPAAAPEAAQGVPAPAAPAGWAHERPLGETLGFVALFGVLAGLGLFLARTAAHAPPAAGAAAH